MEFGTEKRIVTIVARGLYVLKSFGDAWRAKLKEMLKSLGKKFPRKTLMSGRCGTSIQMETLIISTCYVMLKTFSTYISSQSKTWMR